MHRKFPGVWVLRGVMLCLMGFQAQGQVINEFMASNGATMADADGDFEDWIELYNPGDSAIDLTGYYLSDDFENLQKWQFPSGSIEPGEHFLVWASGKDKVDSDGFLHTNFSISADGEPLTLMTPDDETILDFVPALEVPRDISYGRAGDGANTWVFFAIPTPGAANETEGYQDLLLAPQFSHDAGFYSEGFYLEMLHPDPQASIYYTLDGSTPDPDSAILYTEPIWIDSREGEPDVFSMIPTAPPSEWRAPLSESFKTTVVKAIAVRSGFLPDTHRTRSYFVDDAIHERYGAPVISISTDAEHLFSDATGLLVPGDMYNGGSQWGHQGNYTQSGEAWERPIDLEYFEEDGSLAFSTGAGLRIHGGSTRRMDQKSLRIYFRNRYGMDTLAYPLFPDKDILQHRRIILRSIRAYSPNDEFYQSLFEEEDLELQYAQPAIVFINGEFWGLHMIRDRIDQHNLAIHHDLDVDKIDLVDGSTTMSPKHGSMAEFIELMAYIDPEYNRLDANTGVPTPLTLQDPEAYAHVASQMDIDNFIVYQLAEIYSANYDWPGKNLDFWRAKDAGIPWRWIFFDVELVSPASRDMLNYATAVDGPTPPPDFAPNSPQATFLLRALLENESFRNAFINKTADLLNTTLQPHVAHEKLDRIYNRVGDVIAEHSQRWKRPGTWSWGNNRNQLRSFANQRPGYMRQHTIDYFNLSGLANIKLDVNAPGRGAIQINSITIDENTLGLTNPSQPYPWSGVYFQGMPITLTAHPEPGFRFSHWEGLDEKALIEKGDASAHEVVVTLTGDGAISAVFTAEPVNALLHYWHFNDLPGGHLDDAPADFSLLGDAVITYPGSGDGFMDRVNDGTLLNARLEAEAGRGLRVRNPADRRELLLTLPTTEYQDIVLRYAVNRTNNGAQMQALDYRTASDGPWTAFGDPVSVTEEYQPVVFDFSDIDAVNDNPDFAVRLRFEGPEAANSSGNNRFDNISVEGQPTGDVLLPPQLIGSIPEQFLVAGDSPTDIDLSQVFATDPAATVIYSTSISNPDTLLTSFTDNVLHLHPQQQGGVTVTVTVSDGENPALSTDFEVLVYPAPHALQDSDYAFTAWSPNAPEHSYPPHMLFLQSDLTDPGLAAPLDYAYHVPHDDYHEDDVDTLGFPYNNTRRTRLNGLGDDGISFINTGRGRDLGGALLALDTTGLSSPTWVEWLGGTVLTNERAYELRLQYRVGATGPFQDLVYQGEPVAYTVRPDGHSEPIGPALLPTEALDQPYVQLLWRYHHVGGDSGPRSELRLDDILVSHIAGATPPPEVRAPLPLQKLVEQGAPAMIDLGDLFDYAGEDDLAYSVTIDRPFLLSGDIASDVLSLQPLQRGESEVRVEASDGANPPAVASFRVLIHPAAHPLREGGYQFDAWPADSPELSYPNHMLFLQSDQDDPGLHTALDRAYHIPYDEYHEDDAETLGYPYNNTRRTRLTGLNADGVAFINTGRGRDLGGALLALDTTDLEGLPRVAWLGGTLLTNSRSYEIRLQYRLGHSGPFYDMQDDKGAPMAYKVYLNNDVKNFDPITLPEVLHDQPYVQLLWRYRHIGGTSGPRAELRLDDIAVDVWEVELPPGPEVSGAEHTNNSQPTWTWTSNDGEGVYRYRWSGDAAWLETESAETEFSPDAPLEEGAHTLEVQEQHANGLWSQSGSHTINVDTTPPTVSIASTTTESTHFRPIPVDLLFSEEVVGLEPEDLEVDNATIQNFAGEGATYVLDLFPEENGTVTLRVPEGVCTDLAGNPNEASELFEREYDEENVPLKSWPLLLLFLLLLPLSARRDRSAANPK